MPEAGHSRWSASAWWCWRQEAAAVAQAEPPPRVRTGAQSGRPAVFLSASSHGKKFSQDGAMRLLLLPRGGA